MNPDIDIIYYSLFPWENEYSSVSLSLAKELSKNNRVFYINKPWSIKDYFKNRDTPLAKERAPFIRAKKMRYEEIFPNNKNLIGVHPPLTIPINFLPSGKVYKYLSKKNHEVVIDTVKQVIEDYNIKNYVYLNCYNPYHGALLPKELNPQLNLYQCIDDMLEEAYTAKHGARLEDEVIAEADIVTVTSTNLYQLKSPLNKNMHIVHNAADFSIFRKATEERLEKPSELKEIQTKTIGFTGNMDPNRINYDLLKKVALYHHDKTLVLVGPINSGEYQAKGLDKISNIIWTGPKDIRELPAYLQHFDCVLIPFKLNKLTASIYPLKINEYLAAGKSVISTHFSKDIAGFSDVINLAENEEEFLKLIDKGINENSQADIEKRVSKAKENTWTARVNQLWEIITPHLKTSEVTTSLI